MADAEMVMRGLQAHCMGDGCEDCPYYGWDECRDELIADAYAVLSEVLEDDA